MILDKQKSKKQGSQRISEGMMFFLATLFGSVGVFLGMYYVRHKSQKWYFLIGIPLLFVQNMATLYVVYLLLRPDNSVGF
jgi:uncharacterized membrane protein YsdA (DUF1294 family)